MTLYVISVCQGEEIPRKGGPGITKSDFLIISKSELALYVNVDLEVMRIDAARMRGSRPFAFTDPLRGKGLEYIIDFIIENGGLTSIQTHQRLGDRKALDCRPLINRAHQPKCRPLFLRLCSKASRM
ncbi:hypothetical protein FHX15_005382 [Rhizobium sp. BK650]|nr:hypothetical protein [Rhizobium sp. BK650]